MLIFMKCQTQAFTTFNKNTALLIISIIHLMSSRPPTDTFYYHFKLTGLFTPTPHDIPFNFKLFLYKGSQKSDSTRKVHTFKGTKCEFDDQLSLVMTSYNPKRRVEFSLHLMEVGEEEIESTACALPIAQLTEEYLNTGKNRFNQRERFQGSDFQVEYTMFVEKSKQNLLAVIDSEERNRTPTKLKQPQTPPAPKPQSVQKRAQLPKVEQLGMFGENKFRTAPPQPPAQVTPQQGKNRKYSSSSKSKAKTNQGPTDPFQQTDNVPMLTPDFTVKPLPTYIPPNARPPSSSSLSPLPELSILPAPPSNTISRQAKQQNVPGPQLAQGLLTAPPTKPHDDSISQKRRTKEKKVVETKLDDSHSKKKKDGGVNLKAIVIGVVVLLGLMGLAMLGGKTKSAGKKYGKGAKKASNINTKQRKGRK